MDLFYVKHNFFGFVHVQGRDDMQMCELSLEESGLACKRGAEILVHEFETEWQKFGGPPYRGNAVKSRPPAGTNARRPVYS